MDLAQVGTAGYMGFDEHDRKGHMKVELRKLEAVLPKRILEDIPHDDLEGFGDLSGIVED